jgi:hypothetical protein
MPVHGDALDFCAKSASNKMLIGLVARHIRPNRLGISWAAFGVRPEPVETERTIAAKAA